MNTFRIRPCAIIQDQQGAILTLEYFYNGKNVFQLPGGNMDKDETPQQTLARELKEELSLIVKVKEQLAIIIAESSKDKSITHHYIYRVEINNQIPVINPAETTAIKITWLNVDEAQNALLYPAIGPFLAEILNSNVLIQKQIIQIIY